MRANIDPAIKHVELTSIISFPRVGGGPSFVAEWQKTWVPAYAGKGRASTYLIAGSIEAPQWVLLFTSNLCLPGVGRGPILSMCQWLTKIGYRPCMSQNNIVPMVLALFAKGNVARYPQGLAVDKARGLITTLTRLVHSREAPCGYLAARGAHPNMPRSGGSRCCWRRGIRSARPGTALVEASTRRSEDRCFFFFGSLCCANPNGWTVAHRIEHKDG